MKYRVYERPPGKGGVRFILAEQVCFKKLDQQGYKSVFESRDHRTAWEEFQARLFGKVGGNV